MVFYGILSPGVQYIGHKLISIISNFINIQILITLEMMVRSLRKLYHFI